MIEAPEYLFIPTINVMTYVSVCWVYPTRVKIAALQQSRELVHEIFLPEWAVFTLPFLVRTAHDGLRFFTNCPDLRLTARRHEPPCERGMLLGLKPGLVCLIRSVGVRAILEVEVADPEDPWSIYSS